MGLRHKTFYVRLSLVQRSLKARLSLFFRNVLEIFLKPLATENNKCDLATNATDIIFVPKVAAI